jgi:choline transporter-like protein 2/4/5
MIVAGAVGSWYWKRNKKLFDPKAMYVLNSTKRAVLYHFGTVAFGSFIVAVVQFIRILFEKFYSELKKATGDNKVWKGVAWAVRIFLFLFELLIKYINKHAYVQTALYGSHFIKSAINAFTLLTRNFMQIGILQTITTIALFMGKVLVSMATCFVGYGLSYSGWLLISDRGNPISSPLLVACICFLIAFTISSIFIRIVDTAIDTILQCFLVDYEMCYNDPTRKPYCTRTLGIFIKEQRALDKLEKFVCQCCCCFTGCCQGTSKGDPAEQMGAPPQ